MLKSAQVYTYTKATVLETRFLWKASLFKWILGACVEFEKPQKLRISIGKHTHRNIVFILAGLYVLRNPL